MLTDTRIIQVLITCSGDKYVPFSRESLVRSNLACSFNDYLVLSAKELPDKVFDECFIYKVRHVIFETDNTIVICYIITDNLSQIS